MKPQRAALLAVVLLLGAASPPPGATSCSGCHGGIAPLPILAGQDPAAMVTAMAAFRSGDRPATVMDRIAKGFSPAETQAIAAWWAKVAP